MDLDINSGKIGTRAGWNATWNVNVAGTHMMTNTFIPLLLKSSKPRLLFMTSGTASLTEAAAGPPPNVLSHPRADLSQTKHFLSRSIEVLRQLSIC